MSHTNIIVHFNLLLRHAFLFGFLIFFTSDVDHIDLTLTTYFEHELIVIVGTNCHSRFGQFLNLNSPCTFVSLTHLVIRSVTASGSHKAQK